MHPHGVAIGLLLMLTGLFPAGGLAADIRSCAISSSSTGPVSGSCAPSGPTTA
jgi:hypothetical protein